MACQRYHVLLLLNRVSPLATYSVPFLEAFADQGEILRKKRERENERDVRVQTVITRGPEIEKVHSDRKKKGEERDVGKRFLKLQASSF